MQIVVGENKRYGHVTGEEIFSDLLLTPYLSFLLLRTSLVASLENISGWVAEDTRRRIATLPDLVELRLRYPRSPLWRKLYIANSSQEVYGKDVLVSHGCSPWTLESIKDLYQDGLSINDSFPLTRETFEELLHDSQIPVVEFEDYLGLTDAQINELGRYRIHLCRETSIQPLPVVNGSIPETPLFIARCGGRERAARYADRLTHRYSSNKLKFYMDLPASGGNLLYLGVIPYIDVAGASLRPDFQRVRFLGLEQDL